MRIGIVTDSTADLPLEYYEQNDVVMAPLTVRFGDEVLRDWVDIRPEEFYKRMKTSNVLPRTSQPAAGDFVNVYRSMAEKYEHIISVHISAKLSGTLQSAQAAKQVVKDIPITLVDSKLTTIGLALIVKGMVAIRKEGATVEDLVSLAEDYSRRMKVLFMVDTLKYLELGGRIGKAQALLGSLLSVKPILTLDDGLVASEAKVKGSKKAIREMVSKAVEEISKHRATQERVHLVIAQADNPAIVDRLKGLIDEAGAKYTDFEAGVIGPVIGTYTGPGAFALAVL